MMTFGVFLSYNELDPRRDGSDLYANMLNLGVLADSLGFDNIWVPEHHLIHYLQSPSALLAATYIGQRVSCRVGTAVVVLPYHHPLMLAGEVAAVDQILEGRFEFGVARGAYQYEFDRFGLDFEKSREQFDETLDVMVKAWQSPDQAIEHHGQFYDFGPSYVWPRPTQLPHPPIWVGAMSDASARAAVKKGHNVFHAAFRRPMQEVARIAEAFHEEREASGHARGARRVAVSRMAYVSRDEASLRARAEEAIINGRIGGRLHEFSENADGRGYVSPDPIQGKLDWQGDEKQVRQNLLFGSPDEVSEKLAAYHDAGFDHLSLWVAFGSPIERVAESLQLFAEEVMAPYRQQHAPEVASWTP